LLILIGVIQVTKRQEIAQETRQRIYTTACSLTERNGFGNVSVEDIQRIGYVKPQ